MSRLSDLRGKIHSLAEIQSILGAMKNLAIIEMNKVSKLMICQNRVSQTIDDALTDFESYFKEFEAEGRPERQTTDEQILCLLIGSERGFCGPFNERVIERYLNAADAQEVSKAVVIGRKLSTKLGEDPRVEVHMDGPNSADEIPAIVNELAVKLLPYAQYRWMFIHNDANDRGKSEEMFFPLESRPQSEFKDYRVAPLLNMLPHELYPQLLEQQLFSIMHRALYTSFMAENRERLHHMEGALNQIERDRSQLALQLNSQRQEEITEELEILMLSSLSDTEKESQ